MNREDVKRIRRFVKGKGFAFCVKGAGILLYDAWWERRLHVRTGGVHLLKDLGVTDPACFDYWPAYYWELAHGLKHVDFAPGRDSFLDLGSGKGKAVVMAARYPFRRVMGVELTPELHGVAQKNVKRAGKRLRCKTVELVNGDATKFEIPEDVRVISLFNPFGGEVLSKVLENIRRRAEASRRKICIIYINYVKVKDILEARPWMVKRYEYTGIYPNAIFEVGSDVEGATQAR